MTPTEFVRAVAAVMPGTPSAKRSSAMAAMAPRLKLDFADHLLTQFVVDHVAAAILGFPTYPELSDAVRRAVDADDTVPQHAPEDGNAWHLQWLKFVAESRHDDQRLTRLSVAKQNAEDHTWRELAGLYHDLIRRRAAHWLPFDPNTRAQRRVGVPHVESVIHAAPPPRGPSVTTRPAQEAQRRPASGALSGEHLAAARRNAGIGAR